MKITDVKVRVLQSIICFVQIYTDARIWQVLARLATGDIYRPQRQLLKVCRLPDRKRSIPLRGF